MPAPEVCLDFPLLSEQRSGSKYAVGQDDYVTSPRTSDGAPSLPAARSLDGRTVACVPLQMTHDGFLAAPDDEGLRALDSRLPREVFDDILKSLNAAARSHAAASALVFTSLMVATATLAALVLVPYELYKGRKRLAALESTIQSLNQRYSQYGILLRRRTLPAGAVAAAAASSGRVRPTAAAAAAAAADSSIYSCYSDSGYHHSAYSGGGGGGDDLMLGPDLGQAAAAAGEEVFGGGAAGGGAGGMLPPAGGSGSWDVELQVLC